MRTGSRQHGHRCARSNETQRCNPASCRCRASWRSTARPPLAATQRQVPRSQRAAMTQSHVLAALAWSQSPTLATLAREHARQTHCWRDARWSACMATQPSAGLQLFATATRRAAGLYARHHGSYGAVELRAHCLESCLRITACSTGRLQDASNTLDSAAICAAADKHSVSDVDEERTDPANDSGVLPDSWQRPWGTV